MTTTYTAEPETGGDQWQVVRHVNGAAQDASRGWASRDDAHAAADFLARHPAMHSAGRRALLAAGLVPPSDARRRAILARFAAVHAQMTANDGVLPVADLGELDGDDPETVCNHYLTEVAGPDAAPIREGCGCARCGEAASAVLDSHYLPEGALTAGGVHPSTIARAGEIVMHGAAYDPALDRLQITRSAVVPVPRTSITRTVKVTDTYVRV